MLFVFVSDKKANKKPNKGKTLMTEKPKMPKTSKEHKLIRVSILYFTKEIPTVIFTNSNHLVSINIVLIILNLTIFASVTIYFHP